MFRKKKKDATKSVKEVPLAKVEELVNKGLSKRQIIDFLKSEGYSVDLIEKAFSQMTSKKGVLSDTGAPVSEELAPPSPVKGLPLPSGEELPPLPGQDLDSLEPNVEKELNQVGDIEGLIEVIVEEKFSEMVDKLEDFDNLRETVEGRVDSFHSDLESLKGKVVELEKYRDENLSEHKRTLDEIRLEMGAMEKAFHKLVPNLSSSIRELRETGVKDNEDESPKVSKKK